MKRLLYLGYYLKQMNWDLLNRFILHVKSNYGYSKMQIWKDMISSVFKYNISLLEYFQFGFYKINNEEKEAWAGTGYMYEYQLKMNPPDKRKILDDKKIFYKKYKSLFIHKVANIQELEVNPDLKNSLLENPSGKLVFKKADGKCGKQVSIHNISELAEFDIVGFMRDNDFDLAEEFIIQHPELNKLSPSAVNTVRVFTQLDKNNNVEILGCRLRISVDSSVDNLAAGNIAAPVDENTGIVTGSGVYSDITKADESVHPVTGVPIVGFRIPFWDQILYTVREAALMNPQNRSIGWDVAVTEKCPGLIEGNHDWCKLVWQLPVKKGLKPKLDRHRVEFQK